MRTSSWRARFGVLGMVMVVGTTAITVGTAASSSAASAKVPKIPTSAFSDHTGVTSNQVNVGTVYTNLVFPNAPLGVKAYFDYINSTGGVRGRKIVVNPLDDGYSGPKNQQATQEAISSNFALVGNFSTYDSYGGTVLAKNPNVPDVSVTLDPTTNKLPNVVSPVPLQGGWELGPLQYYKKKFPQGVKAVGALIADQASAEDAWAGEKSAMQHIGYKVLYAPTFSESTTDFTSYIIQMKNKGVKMLFLEQMPDFYASTVMKDLTQQNYHPQVVFGASTYTSTLLANSGGAAATNGAYLEQNATLYLGASDKAAFPSVATFQKWLNVAKPGFTGDLYSLYGWLSAELFVQALKNAGSNPSRGSLLQALYKIDAFNGGNIITTTNPAAKTQGNCYLLAIAKNGQFQRIADPPTNSSTHGYRCDYSYYLPPSS